MKIAIGSDHAGFKLKEKIKALLEQIGHQVKDCGTYSEDSTDYPDYGMQVARSVADGETERGITICWTGNGMNMVVNKLPEIRGAYAFNEDMAKLSREHNDANILTLASKYVKFEEVQKIIKIWLETDFEGGRHEQRIRKFSFCK